VYVLFHLSPLFFFVGANLNITDMAGWTPLHAAASTGHLKICQLLIEQPTCDVRAVNNENSSVLHYLVRKPVNPEKVVLYRDVMDRLVSANIDVNVQNKHGEAALHSACMRGNVDAVRFLLSNNADPNIATSYVEFASSFSLTVPRSLSVCSLLVFLWCFISLSSPFSRSTFFLSLSLSLSSRPFVVYLCP
jgi:ankyrin repeat protein